MEEWLRKIWRWQRYYFPRALEWPQLVRVRHINLFFALMFSLAAAVGIALFAAWALAPRLNVGTEPTPPADLTRLALTIAAGVGGVVALVVAYRRQRDLEKSRFVEAFGAAAKLLGDADVAVRLAGVYAMAGVADQSSRLKRQQCIDVLCGYLRLPYSPGLGKNHQVALSIKTPALKEGDSEQQINFQYRQNDKVVRDTILRVIVEHLDLLRPNSWTANDFDFTGCQFEDVSFTSAHFGGKQTDFSGATFSGEKTSFIGAMFTAQWTDFSDATFTGKETTFAGSPTFRSECTSFVRATFSAEKTTFEGSKFGDSFTTFKDATFSSKVTSFKNATFDSGFHPRVERPADGTTFEGANFSGESTVFEGATFSGARISFRKAKFGVGRVTFEHPKAWSPAPTFDWDNAHDSLIPKPANVEPQDWPPPIAE